MLLWSDNEPQALGEEFSTLLSDDSCAVFISYQNGAPAGFAQVQLRNDYVEGTSGGSVGYLEGVFVKEEYRRRGIAKAMLSKCEQWAKENGCREFASDCELTNDTSLAFHLNAGFEEANRIICFTKKL